MPIVLSYRMPFGPRDVVTAQKQEVGITAVSDAGLTLHQARKQAEERLMGKIQGGDKNSVLN